MEDTTPPADTGTLEAGGQASQPELDQAASILNPGATPQIDASHIKLQFRATMPSRIPELTGPISTGGGAAWRGGRLPLQSPVWELNRTFAVGIGHYTLVFFETNAKNANPVLLNSVTVKNSALEKAENTIISQNTCSWFQGSAPQGASSLLITVRRGHMAADNGGALPPAIYCKCYYFAGQKPAV